MILEFPLWVIPTVITVMSFVWAIFWVDDGGGYFSGLTNLLALIPASLASMIVWIVYAIFK